MRLSRAFPLLAALLLVAGCAHQRLKLGETAEGEVVEAVGETLLDPADRLGTKQRSLVEAQKKAVEMAVGVRITAKAMVEKAVEIQSNILARTDGYVKKYEVLKEWEDPPFYKTKIRALVASQTLSDDLKALGLLKEPQVGNPRVAVLLSEAASGIGEAARPTEPSGEEVPPPNAAWARPTEAAHALAQALLDKGYRVVDRGDLRAARAQAIAEEVRKGDLSHVGDLGQQLDAEVLVFGEAQAAPLAAENLGGLVSYRATLSGQAYKGQTNEVLATVQKTASGLDATKPAAAMKALAAVGQLAGTELADRLAKELLQRAFVSITVNGLPNLNRLSDVERVVAGVPGVGDYYLRSFAGGSARLDVQMQSASSRDIASALERATALGAKVKNITQDTIDVAIAPTTTP